MLRHLLQPDILNRAFNFSLVFILELVLITHHQVGVWHTQLQFRRTQRGYLKGAVSETLCSSAYACLPMNL